MSDMKVALNNQHANILNYELSPLTAASRYSRFSLWYVRWSHS